MRSCIDLGGSDENVPANYRHRGVCFPGQKNRKRWPRTSKFGPIAAVLAPRTGRRWSLGSADGVAVEIRWQGRPGCAKCGEFLRWGLCWRLQARMAKSANKRMAFLLRRFIQLRVVLCLAEVSRNDALSSVWNVVGLGLSLPISRRIDDWSRSCTARRSRSEFRNSARSGRNGRLLS